MEKNIYKLCIITSINFHDWTLFKASPLQMIENEYTLIYKVKAALPHKGICALNGCKGFFHDFKWLDLCKY